VSTTFSALSLQLQKALQERQFRAAVGLLRQVLALEPHSAAAHYNLGAVLSQIGEWEAAAASFDRAIAAQPDNADAYFNRGNVLYALKRLDAAIASYDLAIAQRPAHAGAYCNRANILSELGHREAAIASFDKAIAVNPRSAVAFYSRGVVLKELNRLEEALDSYSHAIAVNPNLAAAYCNRGVVLKDMNQWDAALEDFDRAIELDEKLAEAYCNKGTALAGLGRVEEAVGSFNRAISLKGNYPSAQFGRATTWLLGGDYVRGWAAYESRWQKDSGVGTLERKHFDAPPWLGERPIAGRTILLYGEQGLGDTLQFCRYATLVARLGVRVILEVPASLTGLLASVGGVFQVVPHGEAPPPFDYHCPLMSLPLAFKTTLADVPAPRRYVHSPQDRVHFWREKIAPVGEKLKVGLVWSGGSRPSQPEAWPALKRRNIPLEKLQSLRHPDIQFFSLQVAQPAKDELARLVASNWGGPDILDYTDGLTDFSETAGLIDNLDLVIAVDTSIAHLAGALGKPVWILNRFDTCWRWLFEGDSSPWYPSARLYRQRSPGSWESAIERMRLDLHRENFRGNAARV
jgi:tetratricopeptide (TPR) repeat protein